MVTYGDGVADVDIRSLVDFHRSHGRLATVTAVCPISRFGALEVSDSGKVLKFLEKPKLEDQVSAGFFVFNKDVFSYLTGDDCVLEKEPLEQLVRAGELMAYRHNGFFFAMDTYRDYLYLNEMWEKGQAPWKMWE